MWVALPLMKPPVLVQLCRRTQREVAFRSLACRSGNVTPTLLLQTTKNAVSLTVAVKVELVLVIINKQLSSSGQSCNGCDDQGGFR